MSTIDKDYKFELGDKFEIEIEGFTQDENGNPAYETNFGALRESDIESLPMVKYDEAPQGEVSIINDDNNVLLLITRLNDLDYQEKLFFDNWLDAYKKMFSLLCQDFTAEEVEEAMKSSQIKINQYSASMERAEGKFIYQIIKLSEG